MTPTLVAYIIAFISGACFATSINWMLSRRPYDQADAIAALRRIHNATIYGPPDPATTNELDYICDVIDSEIADAAYYEDEGR